MRNAVTISTTDWNLWVNLSELQLEGVSRVPHLEHKGLPHGKPTYKVVLAFASAVAVDVFSGWLLEQLKNHPESGTKIENQSVAHDRAQITTIIGENVTINNDYGEKQPDRECVPDE